MLVVSQSRKVGWWGFGGPGSGVVSLSPARHHHSRCLALLLETQEDMEERVRVSFVSFSSFPSLFQPARP